jgi:exodeoxyribonuclease VII small subunit
MSTGNPDTETMDTSSLASFEDAVKRLGEIVELLESGTLPLEESLCIFEEGVRLARASQARLEAAEKRVEELLTVDDAGKPVVRELEMPDVKG